jgi:hypothetical protein
MPIAFVLFCPGGANLNLRAIFLAEGNRHFTVCGDFLLDFDGISIARYFGQAAEVTIWKSIERLVEGCSAGSQTLSSVIFESGSGISFIEKDAFA